VSWPVRVLGAVAGLAAALVPASGASAHGADAPDGTNYRTTVTTVTPAVAGLTVRAVEAGGRLELTNHSGRTIEVLGYQGEPYLEVRPDGVYENVYSPATYLNATLTGNSAVPPFADPAQPPSWRKASGTAVARWHDHRTHWMDAVAPPQVSSDPGRTHRIRDWVVPLRDETSTVEVRGTLDWIPPPVSWVWWGLTLLVAAALALLGLVWDRALPAIAGLAIAAGGTALVYAVARELDAGSHGTGAILLGLLRSQIWPVLTALATVVAGVYALLRRPASDLAVGLAGACLALIAGLANVAVFSRSVVPVPWPPLWARLATVLVLAGGAGLAVAAGLYLRATTRTAVLALATAPVEPAPVERAPDDRGPLERAPDDWA